MTLFKLGFLTVTLIDVIDIILVTWIFYKVSQYFRETRAGQMLVGLVILLISSFVFNSFGSIVSIVFLSYKTNVGIWGLLCNMKKRIKMFFWLLKMKIVLNLQSHKSKGLWIYQRIWWNW